MTQSPFESPLPGRSSRSDPTDESGSAPRSRAVPRLLAGSFAVVFVMSLWGCPDNSPAQIIDSRPTVKLPAATSKPTSTPGPCGNQAGSGSGLSGCIGTSASPSPGPSTTPGPSPTPAAESAFGLSPGALTLYVPPPAGAVVLFSPTSATLAASGSAGTVGWQSSDPAVAQVDGTGQVTAGQAGTAVMTATDGTRRATASVTVLAEAELQVAAQGGMPAGASVLAMTVTDASGTVLFTGGATADLTDLANLNVQAQALSGTGAPVAAGRYQGLTLVPGELQTAILPFNQPSIQSVQAGGPGAWIDVNGSGLMVWHQGPGTGTYTLTIAATADGNPALISALSGLPGTRSLLVTVGGVPVSTTLTLLGSVQIASPPATLSLGASNGMMGNQYQYQATTLDTAGNPVNSAAVSWSLLGGDLSSPAVGTMDMTGLFTPTQTGTATVAVHSGTLVATASLQVVP